MNERLQKQLTGFASLAFALLCLLWVAFTYAFLPILEGQNDYSIMVKDNEWIFTSLAGLLASIAGIYAIMGIYYANRKVGGFILFTGVVFLILGFALEMASLTWDVFIWPVMSMNDEYLSFIREGIFIRSIQFKIFIIALLIFLSAGNILTAVGLIKTKKYGITMPLLLIIGILFYVAGNLLLVHIATAGLLIYSISFILIGLKLFKEPANID